MKRQGKTKEALKWRTYVGLLLMFLAVIFNIPWLWGIFYLFWVIPDLYRKETYFIEHVSWDENPVLFSLIVGSFLLLSFYTLLQPIFFPGVVS